MKEHNDYKWFLAGSMLGMMGAYMGQSWLNSKSSRRMAKKSGKSASHMSREAGELLGAMGESLMNRMH